MKKRKRERGEGRGKREKREGLERWRRKGRKHLNTLDVQWAVGLSHFTTNHPQSNTEAYKPKPSSTARRNRNRES